MKSNSSFSIQAHMPGVQFVAGVGFVEGGVPFGQPVASLSGEADIAMISGFGAGEPGATPAPAPEPGFSFSQVPWWGWLAAGGLLTLAFMALNKRR